ncbi:uncharacterized protein [Primulina eburnea]|uniref:uncharacterized protein isoform X2 n=1 Tax=Primulina eburnea TaxID=1245227 RepID=UPI003C6C5841
MSHSHKQNSLYVNMEKNTPKRKYACLEDRRMAKNSRRNKKNQLQIWTSSDTNCVEADLLQSIVNCPDLLPDVPNCEFCDAKRIYLEPPAFYCASGEINLLLTEMPSDLVQLYCGSAEDAREFTNCVRSYNNMFAFTSLGVHCDKSLSRRNDGIYTFRVQGQLYHFMDQLIPSNNEIPKNLQLYFFDTEHEISNRMCVSTKFKENLIQKLIHILALNPYASFFRSLNSIKNLSEYKISLQADPIIDQRTLTKPTVSQVAGIWLESNEHEQCTSQHIQVYPKDNRPQIIKHYFSCYDPMQYPLIFPNGESGWHRKIARLNQMQKKMRPKPICRGQTIYDIQGSTNAAHGIQTENEGDSRFEQAQYSKVYGIMSSMEDKFTTLEHLKPDLQNWFVKVFVSEKTPIRFAKWGRQQKVVFIDKEDTGMQCIIYENDVDQFDKLLTLYKTYYVGNAKIKEISGNTPILAASKYQMILNRSAYIKLAAEEDQLPVAPAYQLTSFAQCQELADVTNKQINLLCSVIHVFPARYVEKTKRNLQEFVVVNEERTPLILTLWEEFLQNEATYLAENVHSMPIILGMRLSVNTFYGLSVGTFPNSTILFDPPLPQTEQLKLWMKSNKEYVESVISQRLYEKENQSICQPFEYQIRKISQILSLTEMVKSFWVRAKLKITDLERSLYFLACPSCSRPCGAAYTYEFTCLYCNHDFPSPKPLLVIYIF